MTDWGIVLCQLFPGVQWEMPDSSDLGSLIWIDPEPEDFTIEYVQEHAEAAEAAFREKLELEEAAEEPGE